MKNLSANPNLLAGFMKTPVILPKWLATALAALLLLAHVHPVAAQSYTLTNSWAMVGATNNLDAANNNRGMAYGMTNQVFVNNKSTHVIAVYDGTTASSNGSVNITGISSGNFTVNKLGVSDDGVLYAANLNVSVSASGPYKLYRWSDWTQAPINCYATTSGDAVGTVLSGKRMGDTFAITGSGINTWMLAGVGSTNAFVLFSTIDGTNFTPTVLAVSGLPGPASGVQFGFAFYSNNTFVVAPNGGGGNLYLVQFPANFASLASPVAATVLATNSSFTTGNFLDLSYNRAGGLLATHANAASAITLFKLPAGNFGALSQLAAGSLSFSTSTSLNGNETGDVALGGTGKTNLIYTLDTSAGLQATLINFAAAPLPPTIATQPVGGGIYTNDPSFTFSVVAGGSQPFSYQWQFNSVSNLATAANISGATNAAYTLNFPPLSASGWYNVIVTNIAGATSSIPVQLIVAPPASSVVVTQLWTLAPGSRPYLGGQDTYDTRGLAYDTNTMTVLVADKNATTFGIFVLDANTGNDLFTLNTLGIGIAGNQFPLDQVGVADDGVAYACNLALAGSAGSFGLFGWPSVNSSAAPYIAFQGDPGNGSGDRWGDTMAVRGAGKNTQILLGSYAGFAGGPATNVALLTTTDGQTFSATLITIPNVPSGFSSLGIAFGAGNTFWAKSPGYDLRHVAFDPAAGTGTVVADYTNATSGISSFSSMSSIGVDGQHNILAGITFNDIPNNLALYQLSTNGAPPNLFSQTFFPSLNGNTQENGVSVVKFPRIYALDVNNGIVAISYGVPPAVSPLPPFTITAITRQAGTGVVLTWQSVAGHVYQVLTRNALSAGAWAPIGSAITASGPTTSFTDTSAQNTGTRYYRIQGQ
jgi:hypothetical protein